jgi:hypothetical protein
VILFSESWVKLEFERFHRGIRRIAIGRR